MTALETGGRGTCGNWGAVGGGAASVPRLQDVLRGGMGGGAERKREGQGTGPNRGTAEDHQTDRFTSRHESRDLAGQGSRGRRDLGGGGGRGGRRAAR